MIYAHIYILEGALDLQIILLYTVIQILFCGHSNLSGCAEYGGQVVLSKLHV